MKVGILTWYRGANYGARAQSYALQQIIKGMGYEVYMIDYRPKKNSRINIKSNINRRQAIKNPSVIIDGIKRCKKFANVNIRYNLTERCRNASDIDNLGLDYVVFGSDAIFNVRHPLCLSVYYGVGIVKSKKVAFSPSCEYLDPNYKLDPEYVASLKEFTSISVRDNNTAQLVFNNTGRDALITLDPTMLYHFDEVNAKLPLTEYILLYSFSDWGVYSEAIREFASEKNLKIFAVGQRCKWADISVSDAAFDLWISAFRNAKYVVTDSFHGTVFALKNNKELILLGRKDKASKIKDLLSQLSIKREFYDGRISLKEYLSEPIDYDTADLKLEELANKSKRYLEEALSDNV